MWGRSRLCVAFLARNIWHLFFFFNDPATPEIYTLSLHDALPIFRPEVRASWQHEFGDTSYSLTSTFATMGGSAFTVRSEEHTSELQSHHDLVCRLLLEKKNTLIWGGSFLAIKIVVRDMSPEVLHH